MYKCWEKYVQIILLGSANTELTLIAAGEISSVQMDLLLVGLLDKTVSAGQSLH